MTSEQLLAQIREAVESLPPEPIGEWMRSQGRPPGAWKVVFPAGTQYAAGAPFSWPDYVTFSSHVSSPVFVPNPGPTERPL